MGGGGQIVSCTTNNQCRLGSSRWYPCRIARCCVGHLMPVVLALQTAIDPSPMHMPPPPPTSILSPFHIRRSDTQTRQELERSDTLPSISQNTMYYILYYHPRHAKTRTCSRTDLLNRPSDRQHKSDSEIRQYIHTYLQVGFVYVLRIYCSMQKHTSL